MKKEFKGLILGSILTTVLFGGSALASGMKQTIEVYFNNVNLTVNGKNVNSDNILYNGMTYVPLRSVAEMLGKNVGWNSNNNTASINDPGFTPDNNNPDEDWVTWRANSSEDITLPIKFKDRTGTLVLGRDHPNGTKIQVFFKEDGYGWSLPYDGSNDVFNQFGDLKDNYILRATVHDFNNDGNPEIVITAGDGIVLGHVWVFSYTSVSDVTKINPFKLELSELTQEKVSLEKNKMVIPYGGQGLFTEYDYTNGHFSKSVQ